LYNLPATLSPTSEKDDSEEMLSPSRIYLLFLRNIHTPIPAPTPIAIPTTLQAPFFIRRLMG